MYAAAYGVKADATYTLSGSTPIITGTSDDVALKAAVDACAATGSKLILPPGMLLFTGAATINLRNCYLSGVGTMGGTLNTPGSYGTMFLITSTSVKPFTIGDHWGMSGVNFFWPNQITGLTVYPPLFSPSGAETDSSQQWVLDHSVIINAYDAVVTGGGAFFVTDSLIYTMRDAFRVGNIGDSFRLNAIHFTPGPWFTMTNFKAPYKNVSDTNVFIHAVAGGTQVPGATNFAATNIGSFGLGVGIKIDNGATVGISEASFVFDGVGTVVDASSGGVWAGFANAPLHGVAGCNDTCFKMGANSTLFLSGWVGGGQRSFIETTGSNVTLNNVDVTGVGGANDGTDYYVVNMMANTGGTTVSVKSSDLQGSPSNAHVHGIKTSVAAARLIIENTGFSYFQDDINAQPAASTIISGDWSAATNGPESIVTASMASGTTPVSYGANDFDKPPKAVITAGFGTGSTITGDFSGVIFPGATGPVTTGSFRLPFNVANSGACSFTSSLEGFISAGASGSPPVWNVLTSDNIQGGQIYYNCGSH